jgi:hypothetical protein
MWIVLQKLFVVIRLDDESVGPAQPFNEQFSRITKIGDKAETARTGVKSEPDRVDRVMRHRECLHENVANRKLSASAKNPPIAMSTQPAIAAGRFGGEGVAINRDVKFAAKNSKPADVIAMFVGEEDSVELFWRDPTLLQTQDDLARAQSAINQDPAMISRHQSGVPSTAAPEHGEAEHARI